MNPFQGKVAVHGITWGHEYEQSFAEAAQLGFRAIEPWPSYVFQYEQQEEALQEKLAGYGLQLTGAYGGASGIAGRRYADPAVRGDIIDYNVRLARILSKCGAGHIVSGPGVPRAGKATPEEIRQMALTINEMAKRTLEYGVKSCVHPHLWTEIQDEDELDALLEQCGPEVYFAPDTAHLTGAGMDAAAIIERYKERVAYVHLKDLSSRDAAREDVTMVLGNEALTVFCELGLGTIDFHPIIGALNKIGYKGWLTVEIDHSTSTPWRSLEICRDYVEQQLGIPIRTAQEG